VGSVWSPGAALAVSGLVMFAGTAVFALQPASRRWRPDRDATRPSGGALRAPAIRLLVAILLGTGAVFGATDVGVAATAHALGNTTAAGPLLGLWGVGSLLGGTAATRLRASDADGCGLVGLLVGLAFAHGALILTTDSLAAMGAVLTLAGATIAPTVSRIYAMVDTVAPAGTRTEAFSWLVTASLVGGSVGTAAAGALAQSAGAPAAFALAGAGGGLAVLVAALGEGRGLRRSATAPGCAGAE
jgi:predicted MFS family arabinose efflux permease